MVMTTLICLILKLDYATLAGVSQAGLHVSFIVGWLLLSIYCWVFYDKDDILKIILFISLLNP